MSIHNDTKNMEQRSDHLNIKTFSALTTDGLDRQINAFLNDDTANPIVVVDIKFSLSNGTFSAMVVYKF